MTPVLEGTVLPTFVSNGYKNIFLQQGLLAVFLRKPLDTSILKRTKTKLLKCNK